MKGKCIVNHCFNDVHIKGYCTKHYREIFRINEVNIEPPKKDNLSYV